MPLNIQRLTIQYKSSNVPILKDLDLQIDAPEITLIVGSNGSGKSTLLRSIVKQFFPGTLEYVSGRIDTPSDIIRVLQRVKSQILAFSVKEELGMKLGFRQVDREERIQRILAIANKFGIISLLDHDPHLLSSGQLQLIIILASLIDSKSESIILMDEPFSLLDQNNTALIQKLLLELKNQGNSIIITSPIKRQVDWIDTVCTLEDGKVTKGIQELRPLEFKPSQIANPNSFWVEGKIGYHAPLLDVSFKFPSAGLYLVTGANGSGKTAILLSLSKLLPMVSGNLSIDPVFYLPQDPMNIFWRKTVEQEVRNIPEWMEPYAKSSPFTLSEGERKKIALHIAFTSKRHLALDEPTQSLDEDAIQWFLSNLEQVIQTRLVIIATNDLELIDLLYPFSDRISLEGRN